MSHAEFVHLHLHSEYSLLDGACRIDRLVDRAHSLRFPALALTDHGAMHGAIDFYQAAREKGIKPIVGCEVYVAPGSRRERKAAPGGRDAYQHLVLLAKDETGYRNLMQLTTQAHLEGFYYKPRVDKELLAERHQGLIALSGCLASEIPELIVKDQIPQARAALEWYRDTFGPEDFYLELQDHGLPEQAQVNRLLIQWAREFGLKLVATNDVHYLEKEHSHAHDVLLCIGTQTTLNDPRRLGAGYPPGQFHLRSYDEMESLFGELPEALSNTLEVAEKCNLELKFGDLHYPAFAPPPPWTRESFLRERVAEGLRERYTLRVRPSGREFVVEGIDDPARLPTVEPGAAPTPEAASAGIQTVLQRLQHELRIIEKTHFESYFLIVGDFVQFGHSKGIACVARGSGAGSLVTYLLNISNIDPLRYGLLFERFLNPERISPPDIDIDFADDRRAEVIAYVREKYGPPCVAQIITFGTMGAKSVVRDVARAMGLPPSEGDRLARMIPNELKMNLTKALQHSPDFKAAYETEDVTKELVNTALILEDLTRNASVHAAGVVIADEPLANLLPLKLAEDGSIVTQYAMGPVGELGLLKMDFLGLKTLSVIRNACDMIRATRGVEVPIDQLPLDDAPTYELLNKANTLGVFQLESSGMRDLCRKFQIGSLEHITALIALYRPGPMELIPEFIRRRQGEVQIVYEHPLLEPICGETYGIMVYQEQVMQAAQVLAGYTLGAADILRRAMGKKKAEEMAAQRETFVVGCAAANDIPPEKAHQIFNLLEKFAGYGFNKSHAAAYAVVAYQTAYLKANYPIEFFCAMMTNDMGDTDKLSLYVAEARSSGIDVLPPDVNESGPHFAPSRERPAIRFGLAAVKNLGEAAVEAIVRGRTAGGPFASLADFCARVDAKALNRKVLETLIRCGACDGLGENRATLTANLEGALARGSSIALDRARGQGSLFGFGPGAALQVEPSPIRKPEWPESELLAGEKELLGFYVTGHPLTRYAALLETYSLATTATLAELPSRSMTRIGGLIAAVQGGVSKKTNKPYAMVTLEDLHGSVAVLFVNEAYDTHRELLVPKTAVIVTGEVNRSEDKPKLFPVEVAPLEQAPRLFTQQVHFRLNSAHLNRERLMAARDLALAHRGTCPLFLCVMLPAGQAVFLEAHEQFAVTPSLELERAADQAFGQGTYYAKVDTTLPARATRRWERREGPPPAGEPDPGEAPTP